MSSLTVQELALVFMHTCSRPAQDRQRNSEKHLEAERIDVQINPKSENRNRKISVGSDYPSTPRLDKHAHAPGLSDPTEMKVGF